MGSHHMILVRCEMDLTFLVLFEKGIPGCLAMAMAMAMMKMMMGGLNEANVSVRKSTNAPT